MAISTVIAQSLPESATAFFTGVLKDETTEIVPGGSLTTLTLTLYNKADRTIINSRNKHSILNVNGGSVDVNGVFTLTLAPADMTIVRTVKSQEVHVALLEWTYSSTKAGKHLIEFTVINMHYV
jgi:hypothetical protein